MFDTPEDTVLAKQSVDRLIPVDTRHDSKEKNRNGATTFSEKHEGGRGWPLINLLMSAEISIW